AADPERRRAIVLVTDGVPFVHGVDAQTYRASLRAFVKNRIAQTGTSIDVLLLKSRNSTFWSEISRVQRSSSDPGELLPHAHEIIARLVGTRTAESARSKTNPAADTLDVPPYLDVIVFDVFAAAADAALEIVPPG